LELPAGEETEDEFECLENDHQCEHDHFHQKHVILKEEVVNPEE